MEVERCYVLDNYSDLSIYSPSTNTTLSPPEYGSVHLARSDRNRPNLPFQIKLTPLHTQCLAAATTKQDYHLGCQF